ncbi:MAG: DUF58 domain-containing protein [Opitutales bacterium]|nr:DUF58 domain-containing protein [Opitutales bacterium]
MSAEAEKTRAILRKVRQVEIKSRRFVDDALVGAYHSVFKGAGIDFSEVREYQAGDDVRAIDWNVTARMDRPFIKIYEEERELTIMLLIDVSGSNDFGSVEASKRELAAEIASVLALSATRNNDKVGLLLFSDRIEKFIAPKKGRPHVLRVVREILFHQPQGRGTDIPEALRHLLRILHRRAICFLVSDFLAPETLRWTGSGERTADRDDLQRSLALMNRRHDLICIELHDPREESLPAVGIVVLEDAESGQLVEVDTGNRRFRELYARENVIRRERLHATFRRSGVDAIPVRTDAPYIQSVRAFFRRRERRR